MRFICHVPGDTNGLIFSPATAELGLSLSLLVTMSTMNNVRVIGQQQLQVLSRKAFGRFLFSKSEVMLLCALSQAIVLVWERKKNMLGIPHARVPTCTFPCLDPTSTVEDNTNWVMIDLGSHYRCSLCGVQFVP